MKVAIYRRYRLAFSVFLILLLSAIYAIQSRSVDSQPVPTVVAIARTNSDPLWDTAGTDYPKIKALVREAVEKAGGLGQVITPGCTVMLKPNMVEASPPNNYSSTYPTFDFNRPNSGSNTNCWVTRAVVELAREAGAGLVVIAEGTAEDTDGGTGDRFVTRLAFYNSGYDRNPRDMVDDFTGAPLIDLNDVGRRYGNYPTYPGTPNTNDPNYNYDLNKVSKVTLTNGLIRSDYWISKRLLEPGLVLITIPTLKNHNGPGVTGALKNAIGHAPNDIYHDSNKDTLKARLVHNPANNDTIAKTIVDLNLCKKPDFVVIDGLIGVMNGPAGYSKKLITPNPYMRCIIAGRDPVAVDTICSLVMGYDPASAPYMSYAVQKGLGTNDLKLITVKGMHVASVRYDFTAPYGTAVRAERVPPVMGAVYPASGAYVAGTVRVGTPSASDNTMLLKAELYIDNELTAVDTDYPYEFAWDTTTVPDGPHDVKVYVYDKFMNETVNRDAYGIGNTLHVCNSSPMASLRSLEDNTPVVVGGMLASTSSSDLAGRFYIQQANRQSGICVVSGSPGVFVAGTLLEVAGHLTTLPSGERAISASSVIPTSLSGELKPYAMSGLAVGGATSGKSVGPDGGTGPYNVGLLLTIWGRIDYIGDGFFYVDDGSGILDGTGYKGVRVDCGSAALEPGTTYVSVTGISSIEIVGGKKIRCLRLRDQTDIIRRR